MTASGSHPESNSGPPPASSSTLHHPCTCSQPPSPLCHPPKAPSSWSVAMADIPKLDNSESLAGGVSDSAMDDLKVDFEDPQFKGPGEHCFNGHIIPAPLPSNNMIQFDEALAGMACAIPAPPFSAVPPASLHSGSLPAIAPIPATSDTLTILWVALADLLQRYSVDISKATPVAVQQQLSMSAPAPSSSLQLLGLQPALPHAYPLLQLYVHLIFLQTTPAYLLGPSYILH
ncbi:hypothetical protein H2248_004946 [Termitomyces sp. 'cryptogamus']|nr:hypothetical protein H2248_004946 [Termitomyces sp. 'cryptogamus']